KRIDSTRRSYEIEDSLLCLRYCLHTYIDSDRMVVTANDDDSDSKMRFLTQSANGKARIIWHSDTSPEKRLTKACT
ncbi:hypothetical protein ALC62_07003, partial [Cyphomyrmex costatus]